jgi:pimeloyl-ACP methyl ester carboxylesterase
LPSSLFKVGGGAPVVKGSGEDAASSLLTCIISYVVLGSMPATRSVLQAGGPVLSEFQQPPEIHFVNFAPRIGVPTLLVYGRDGFNYPVDTFQIPLFRLLGTPIEHKRLAILEGGHTPARFQDVICETLDWLDRYLGPVARS